MREMIKEIREKVKRIPKRKLIAISVSVKVIQVAISTYLIKKFLLN
ncbi:hypothetical protein [Thermovibrio sp.]